MKFATIGAMTLMTLSLGGCIDTGSAKQSIGSAAGSLTGGLIGAKPAEARTTPPSTASAPLYAAWMSSDLGRRLDDADRRLAAEAEYEALESDAAGATREWSNTANGHRGSVTPGAAYAVNQYTCRDWVSAVTIDTRQETRRSTACRQPDGTWRPIS